MWDIIYLFQGGLRSSLENGSRRLRVLGCRGPESALLCRGPGWPHTIGSWTLLTSGYPDAPHNALLSLRWGSAPCHLRTPWADPYPTPNSPGKEEEDPRPSFRHHMHEAFLSFLKLCKQILKRVNSDLLFKMVLRN